MSHNQCPQCGYRRQGEEKKCPKCDIYYSVIDEFLAEEEAKDERDLLKTRLKRIWRAQDRKQAFKAELKDYYSQMPKGSVFVLYVIAVFIFAMLMAVI